MIAPTADASALDTCQDITAPRPTPPDDVETSDGPTKHQGEQASGAMPAMQASALNPSCTHGLEVSSSNATDAYSADGNHQAPLTDAASFNKQPENLRHPPFATARACNNASYCVAEQQPDVPPKLL